MIKLTRLNGIPFVINCDLIESVEATPDTIVALTSNQRFVVQEPVDEVIEKVAAFKRRCHPEARLIVGAASDAAVPAEA